MSMTRYVALLRGINVGGNKPIKMDALRAAFVSQGYQNVRTLLASGNVVFDAGEADIPALTSQIEATLEDRFGHQVPVILRSLRDIRDLVETDPFQGVSVDPQTRLYVTFLSDEPKIPPAIPYHSPEGEFAIIRLTGAEVCSVLTLSPMRNTTSAMQILEKLFGPRVTTRNWNTVLKLSSL
jgi:uncharacterized protein (DUF1697 family)